MLKTEIIAEISRVLNHEGQAILACAGRLQQESFALPFQKAIELLHGSLEKGGRVIVTGVGKSGKIAQKISSTLSSTGSLSLFLHAAEALHGDLGMVRSGDVVLALSYTGNTEEILKLLPSFRRLGVALIGLGGNSDSKLALGCDIWLDAQVSSEACPHNLAPTTSTTLALAIGDALAVALMKFKNFGPESFAENHPGGSLGKRLKLTVADLMHQKDAVAVLGPHASMDEIIVLSTQKKLGAVLVADSENRLLGIITDGDLRRALQHRDRFFQMKAEEVMTRSPITASPDMLAQTALELMENRESQISVLPVTDKKGICRGVLRLHDIVRTF